MESKISSRHLDIADALKERVILTLYNEETEGSYLAKFPNDLIGILSIKEYPNLPSREYILGFNREVSEIVSNYFENIDPSKTIILSTNKATDFVKKMSDEGLEEAINKIDLNPKEDYKIAILDLSNGISKMKAYINNIKVSDSTDSPGYLGAGQRCIGPECGIDLCKVMHCSTDYEQRNLYLEPVKSIDPFQILSPPILSRAIQGYYEL